jgi:ficolin
MSLTISDAGNDNLAALTSSTRQVLRVDLGDWVGNTSYAEYDNFRVAGASSKYNMTSLGEYSGTAGQF